MINDFYTHAGKRDLSYIGKFLGYPPVKLRDSNSQRVMSRYSSNVREIIGKIGVNYLELIDIHNAYKHGYRIVPGYLYHSADAYTYLDADGRGKTLQLDKSDLEQIVSLSNDCVIIIGAILKNHYARINHEESGLGNQKIDLTGIIKRAITSKVRKVDFYLSQQERKNTRGRRGKCKGLQ